MKITAQMVKELRDETGAGVMEAKRALEASSGDFEAAVGALREKGAEEAAERSERATEEGVIEAYAHHSNRVGVILELNSETDFVSRGEDFRELAHDLALHIAAMNPKYVSPEAVPAAVIEDMKAEWREQAEAEGKPDAIVDKIVDGRVTKFYAENCLTEQSFVKDEDVQVKELLTALVARTGENIVVRRFNRYELGEEL